MKNEIIEYCILDKRISKEKRKKDLYYYELREYDCGNGNFTIENSVRINFLGTIISSTNILKNREFVDCKEFYNKMNIVVNDNLQKVS